MEEQKPTSADGQENQPRLADVGEHIVIHGLVYRVLRHTWTPQKTGKKGRPVKGSTKVPRDMILRLLGIYQPQQIAPPPAPPPVDQPITPFTTGDMPVPEVVLDRDPACTMIPPGEGQGA